MSGFSEVGRNEVQILSYCTSIYIFWLLLTFPLYIWTQTSELSPPHIFKTGSLLYFDAFEVNSSS